MKLVLCVTDFWKWLPELFYLWIMWSQWMWRLWLLNLFSFKNTLKGLDILFVLKAGARADSSVFWSMKKWSYVRDIFILFRIISGHFHPLLQQAASLACSVLEHMAALLCTEWNHSFKILGIAEASYVAEQHGVRFGVHCIEYVSLHNYTIVF